MEARYGWLHRSLLLRCGRIRGEWRTRPMGYCHCESCRHRSAGPVNAFSLWQPTAMKITKGADNIGTYNKTPVTYGKWCKSCGGHGLTEHPPLKLTDVFAAMLPGLKFQPAVHVNYQEAVYASNTAGP